MMEIKSVRKSGMATPARLAGALALLALSLSLVAWARASQWHTGQLLEELRAEVELDANVRANAVASGINRRLLLLEGFSAFMEVMAAGQASESQMQFYVQSVFPTVDGLAALGVAPGGRIGYIYPPEQGEILGQFNLLQAANPSIARAARQARDSGNLVWVGPVEMGLGEPALLAMNAIYNEGEFWGLAVVVAEVEPLLRLVGDSGDLEIALRTGSGFLLLGDPAIWQLEPVAQPVLFSSGSWELTAIPNGGWQRAIAAELRAFQALTGLVGAGLVAIVYATVRRQLELSRVVEDKTAEAESAGEKERSRLARELHDSVSQALYGIALGAKTLRKKAEQQGGTDLLEPADYILTLAEGGLAEMRALLLGLRPEELEEQGLRLALARLGDGLTARHQIQVQADLQAEPPLTLDQKVALYRIAQEATHNTIKHARATRIEIRLAVQPEQVTLEVADNGLCFDPQNEFPGHLGLKSMHERAALLGGECEIESGPTGTRVRASMPVPSGR